MPIVSLVVGGKSGFARCRLLGVGCGCPVGRRPEMLRKLLATGLMVLALGAAVPAHAVTRPHIGPVVVCFRLDGKPHCLTIYPRTVLAPNRTTVSDGTPWQI
jgi:hypothetical protein